MGIKNWFSKRGKRSDDEDLQILHDNGTQGLISVRRISEEVDFSESELVEIKDQRIIAHLNNAIPDLAQAALHMQNGIQYGGKVLYEAIIPQGTHLLEHSKAGADVFYGVYRDAAKQKGMADFQRVGTINSTANVAAAGIGVASLVVGQYYMMQINTQLTTISSNIEEISGFLEREYRSKVSAIFTQIVKIVKYQSEILMDDSLRKNALNALQSNEKECNQLLQQANAKLICLAKDKCRNFESYEKKLLEVFSWSQYQQVLYEMLREISCLVYTLNLGTASMEHCYFTYHTCEKETVEVANAVSIWNRYHVNAFQIDTDELLRKRQGINAVFYAIPGKINHKFEKKTISKETAEQITYQLSDRICKSEFALKDLFEQDVRIVAMEGKLYYLPA